MEGSASMSTDPAARLHTLACRPWRGEGRPVFLGLRLTAEGSHFQPGQESAHRKQPLPSDLLRAGSGASSHSDTASTPSPPTSLCPAQCPKGREVAGPSAAFRDGEAGASDGVWSGVSGICRQGRVAQLSSSPHTARQAFLPAVPSRELSQSGKPKSRSLKTEQGQVAWK